MLFLQPADKGISACSRALLKPGRIIFTDLLFAFCKYFSVPEPDNRRKRDRKREKGTEIHILYAVTVFVHPYSFVILRSYEEKPEIKSPIDSRNLKAPSPSVFYRPVPDHPYEKCGKGAEKDRRQSPCKRKDIEQGTAFRWTEKLFLPTF